jgi:hypothetical protein
MDDAAVDPVHRSARRPALATMVARQRPHMFAYDDASLGHSIQGEELSSTVVGHFYEGSCKSASP